MSGVIGLIARYGISYVRKVVHHYKDGIFVPLSLR